jgi:hypothetical protein
LNQRAQVVVLSDKAPSVSKAVAELAGDNRVVDGYVCDIGAADSVAEACALVLAKHGVPDV